MKTAVVLVGLIFFLSSSGAFAAGSHSVRPHVRKNGSYVQPHHRTNPDRSRFNNYGTRGNTNPYTGKQGTVDPLKPRKRSP